MNIQRKPVSEICRTKLVLEEDTDGFIHVTVIGNPDDLRELVSRCRVNSVLRPIFTEPTEQPPFEPELVGGCRYTKVFKSTT